MLLLIPTTLIGVMIINKHKIKMIIVRGKYFSDDEKKKRRERE